MLPFVLQESPTCSHSVGYRPLLSFDGVTLPGDPFNYMQQDLADQRAHGIGTHGSNPMVEFFFIAEVGRRRVQRARVMSMTYLP